MMGNKNVLPDEIEIPEIILCKSNRAFEMIRQENVHMKKSKKRKGFQSQAAVIAGVCLFAISSISVAAAVHHYWGRGMNGNLQASDVQQQQLTDQGVAVVYPEKEGYESLKVVQNGVSVVPDTVIVDDQFAYISFTIEGYHLEEGEEPGFENVSVASKEDALNTTGSMYDGIVSGENGEPVYEDGSAAIVGEDGSIERHYLDENGNLEYFMKVFVAEETASLLGQKLQIQFENLGTLYQAGFTNAINGVWDFEIELPKVSSAICYEIHRELEGTNFVVTDAEISPVSMKVHYETLAETEMSEDETGIPEVKGVIMMDGTRIPYLASGGSTGYTDVSHAYSLSDCNRVIEAKEVKALLICTEPGTEPVAVELQ